MESDSLRSRGRRRCRGTVQHLPPLIYV